MPVVAKCYEYGGLGSEIRQDIEESLLGIINLKDTYEAVVSFIKDYKKVKDALFDIKKIIEYNEERHDGLEFEEDFKTIDETEVEEYLKWYNDETQQ